MHYLPSDFKGAGLRCVDDPYEELGKMPLHDVVDCPLEQDVMPWLYMRAPEEVTFSEHGIRCRKSHNTVIRL